MISRMTEAISEREGAILTAALTVFARYGFARTKMDDIAKAAGLARTALYKSYRNKEDIFRALAQSVHVTALDAAKAELARQGPFRQRLEDALIARDIHLLNVGHSGPHAGEIAALYLSLAGDLAVDFNARLEVVLVRATHVAMKNGGFELRPAYRSPKDFVSLLRLALEGIKKEIKATREFDRLARQLIGAMSE